MFVASFESICFVGRLATDERHSDIRRASGNISMQKAYLASRESMLIAVSLEEIISIGIGAWSISISPYRKHENKLYFRMQAQSEKLLWPEDCVPGEAQDIVHSKVISPASVMCL
jgi:hypothetical protein